MALRVLEADGQRAALENGLQSLSFSKRVIARDLNLAVGDLGLDRRSRLHLVVEDDDDLAMVGNEVARCLGERLGARGIELDVDRVVERRLGRTADSHAVDVRTGDDGRVRSILDHEMLDLAGLERVAEVVADRRLIAVLTGLNLLFHILVGERVETGKFKFARFADRVERRLRVRQTRNLNENLVGALNLDNSFGSTERIDAALDDGTAHLHLFVGDCITVSRCRRQNNRQAALDVEALVDLLLRRHEHDDRADDQQRRDDEQPNVAAIVV